MDNSIIWILIDSRFLNRKVRMEREETSVSDTFMSFAVMPGVSDVRYLVILRVIQYHTMRIVIPISQDYSCSYSTSKKEKTLCPQRSNDTV